MSALPKCAGGGWDCPRCGTHLLEVMVDGDGDPLTYVCAHCHYDRPAQKCERGAPGAVVARMPDEVFARRIALAANSDPSESGAAVRAEARRARESEAALEREISISLRPALSLSMATAERASERIAALLDALKTALREMDREWGECGCVGGSPDVPRPGPCVNCLCRAALAKAEAP